MSKSSQAESREDISQIISGRVEQLMRTTILRGADQGDPNRTRRAGIMEAGVWNRDLHDQPAGFTSAVLFDNTLAYALHLSDPTITALVTTELQLNFFGDLPEKRTELTAWTRSLYNDTTGGAASGILADSEGTEIVQATGWFLKVPVGPPEAQVQFERNSMLPLDEITYQPVGELLGATPVTPAISMPVSDGGRLNQPGLHFPKNIELANPRGNIHGGALAMMAGLASQHAMPDLGDFRMQSLRVNFVRPGTGAVQSQVSVRHAGRSLRVVDVELHGAQGKPFVLAQASFTRR